MPVLKFDLAKNIVETAKASGGPEFSVRNVDEFISYSMSGLSNEVSVKYTRKGYEISWQPIFAFTMYTDRRRDPGMRVTSANLKGKAGMATDAAAQEFVAQTIAQFQRGKWKRFNYGDIGILLTGRSSYLDEDGNIDPIAAGSPDPAYKLSPEDWLQACKVGLHYEWVGDGVLATFNISNRPGEDGKPSYDMDIEFEVLDHKRMIDAENLARDIKAGDAKGWGMTQRMATNKVKIEAQVKRLIANAIKRGDTVLPLEE